MKHTVKVVYDIWRISYKEFLGSLVDELRPFLGQYKGKLFFTSHVNKNRWIKIKFVHGNINLKVRFSMENLYLCGFKTTSGNDKEIQGGVRSTKEKREKKKKTEKLWWVFGNVSKSDFRINCQKLDITSSYQKITSEDLSLSNVQVDIYGLQKAIVGLSINRSRDQKEVDRATRQNLLCLAFCISESLRFNNVQDYIDTNMYTGVSIGYHSDLFNKWSGLSTMFFAKVSFNPVLEFEVVSMGRFGKASWDIAKVPIFIRGLWSRG